MEVIGGEEYECEEVQSMGGRRHSGTVFANSPFTHRTKASLNHQSAALMDKALEGGLEVS